MSLRRGIRDRRQRGAQIGQRGVALLMAVVMIAVVSVVTVEFATNTNVEWAAANNARDDMRAHFMTRSGMALGELIVRVQTDVIDPNKQMLGDIQLADFVPMFIGAFGGSQEEVEDFGKLLGVRGDDLKGLGTAIGTFTVEIDTEDDKININCANGTDQEKESLKAKLQALMYFDIYNPLFESAAADGWRRDRDMQVAAIIDYIDKDRYQLDNRGAAEDYGYQNLDDRYEPKNNYLDTVGELKQVRGIDDRFWAVFGDRFTVYGSGSDKCKENLAALEDPKQIAAIIFLTAKDKNDPAVNDFANVFRVAQKVVEAKQWGMQWDSTKTFADFVKDPDAAFGQLLEASGLGQVTGQTPSSTSTVPVQGIELDPQALNQIATSGDRQIYRITAHAQIDEIEKTIVGIWDKNHVNQNPRSPEYARGAWVFWREE